MVDSGSAVSQQRLPSGASHVPEELEVDPDPGRLFRHRRRPHRPGDLAAAGRLQVVNKTKPLLSSRLDLTDSILLPW